MEAVRRELFPPEIEINEEIKTKVFLEAVESFGMNRRIRYNLMEMKVCSVEERPPCRGDHPLDPRKSFLKINDAEHFFLPSRAVKKFLRDVRVEENNSAAFRFILLVEAV
jgi:hypothetical protein